MAAKKKKHQPPPTGQALRPRIEKALNELRTQQALELAKTLYKQDPTPEHKELLKKATLARGHDLASHGYHRDAATVLANAAALDDRPEFLVEIVEAHAAGADLPKALELLNRITDPSLRSRAMTYVADEAVRQGEAAKQVLPPELHSAFDAVLTAAAHIEKGEDEAAKEKLQAIGLQSPFLEWKLFLRGLLAYYATEDDRAIENWSRLDVKRWPFRLAAPLRYSIDRTFAQAQPPATQNTLKQNHTRLNGTAALNQLQGLQLAIANERQLPQAFRSAETALATLKTDAPHLVPRLASCFYWAIIHHGMPEDLRRYQRVFGNPTDDPELARLEALALEVRGDFEMAHRHWQRFEKSVAHSRAWPEEQKPRVRALIWAHMGRNADNVPDFEDLDLPPFLRNQPTRPKALKPGPAECFERALELVPDQLSTYRDLISHYLNKEKPNKAEATARRLLQHFPQDVLTLELLGKLLMSAEKYGEAVTIFERALTANPLDQRMRGQVANAHAYHARALAGEGRFDEARQEYQSAQAMDDRREKYSILCKWAACEFKAGDAAKGQELLDRAYAEKDNRLAVVFSMLIETIRYKLNKLKTQFNKEFNDLLTEPPTATAAVALAQIAAEHRLAGVKYHGQQTHEKKVRTYLEKALKADFTEEQLRKVSASLGVLKISRLHLDYIRMGQERFSKDPYFFLAEAQHEIDEAGSYRFNQWRATEVLNQARKLAQDLPRGDRQDEVLKQIQEAESRIRELNPFSTLFGGEFGGFPFDPFASYDDENEEDFF